MVLAIGLPRVSLLLRNRWTYLQSRDLGLHHDDELSSCAHVSIKWQSELATELRELMGYANPSSVDFF